MESKRRGAKVDLNTRPFSDTTKDKEDLIMTPFSFTIWFTKSALVQLPWCDLTFSPPILDQLRVVSVDRTPGEVTC